MSSSSLVAEEMGNWSEASLENSSSLSLGNLFRDEVSEELFSLNLGEVDFSGDLLLIDKLKLHEVWQSLEETETPWTKALPHVVIVFVQLFRKFLLLLISLTHLEQGVELIDEMLVS